LKMFDSFFHGITKTLKMSVPFKRPDEKRSFPLSLLPFDERNFLDYLMSQLKNNVSEVGFENLALKCIDTVFLIFFSNVALK